MSADPLQVAPPLAEVISTRKQAIWFRIGAMWEEMSEPARALVAYETVLRHNSAHVQAMIRVGEMHQKEHIPTSITYLSTAVRLEPANGSAWASLAYSYVMRGDLDKAYHAYYQAFAHLQDRNDPTLWHGIGLLYDRLGLHDDALAAFDAVLGLKPTFEKADEVYYAVGVMYKERGDYNTAHTYLSKVIAINASPNALAEAYYQIGVIHDLAGNVAGAAEAYEIALRQKNHVRTLQSFAWLKHKTGKSAEGVELLRRASQMEDTDGTTSYLLGRIYMANNEFRVAYDSYQQAVHLDGNNANYWCSIAALYYQRQQHRDAMDAFRRAIIINGNIPEVWFDLGALYEMYNQYNDAVNAYRLAADLQPKNTRFTERLSMLQRAMTSGVAPQPPMGKPASEDVHPMPFVMQRPPCKSDAPSRYGRLPAAPDISMLHQNGAKAEPTANRASGAGPAAISAQRQLQPGPGVASSPQRQATMGSAAMPHVSNGIVVQSNSHASPTSVPGPRDSVAGQQHNNVHTGYQPREPYRVNGAVIAASGPEHSVNGKAPGPSPIGSSRMNDSLQGPVSPQVGRPRMTQEEEHPHPTGLQYRPPPPGNGGVPDNHHESTQATARGVPSSGPLRQDQNNQEDGTWHPTSGRLSSDSRPKQDAYSSQPMAASSNQMAAESNAVSKPLPSQVGLYSTAPTSSYPGEQMTTINQARHTLPTGSTPNAVVESPTARSQLSTGRDSGQQRAQYPELQQSNARGVEASSMPGVKRFDGRGDLGSSAIPKPSLSEEPSRQSVSSSHERRLHGRPRTSEVMGETGGAWAPVSPNGRGSTAVNDGNGTGNRNLAIVEQREGTVTGQTSAQVSATDRGDQARSKDSYDKAGTQVDEEMLPKLPPLPGSHNEQQNRHRGGEVTHSTSGVQEAKHRSFSENDGSRVGSGPGNGPTNSHVLQSSPQSHLRAPASATPNGHGTKSEPLLGRKGSPNFPDQRMSQGMDDGLKRPHVDISNSPTRNVLQVPDTMKPSQVLTGSAEVAVGNHQKGPDVDDRRDQVVGHRRSPVRPRSPNSRQDSRYENSFRGFHRDEGTGSRHSSSPIGAARLDGNPRPAGLLPSSNPLVRSPSGGGVVYHSGPHAHQKDIASVSADGRRETGSEYHAASRAPSLKNPFGSSLTPSFSRPLPRSLPAPHIGLPGSKGPPQSDTTARTVNSEGPDGKDVNGVDRMPIRRTPNEDASGLGKRSASFFENGSVKVRGGEDYSRYEPKSAVISPSVEKQDVPREGPPPLSFNDGRQYGQVRDGRGFGDDHRELKRGRPHHSMGETFVANRYGNGNA